VANDNARTLRDVRRLMKEDLKRSGLNEKDMRVTPLLQDLKGHAAAGYRIEYPLVTGGRGKFFRFRYLQHRGFAALTATKQRYDQPAGQAPEPYFALGVSWTQILAEPKQMIGITEGEKKGQAASNSVLPTIALGGVWCFKSKNCRFLPQLETIAWDGRKVYIFYDSDAVSNPDVVRAENALARELLAHGAHVFIARIPALGGNKTGVDDYLVAKGAEAFGAEVLERACEWEPSQELFRLNEEVAYVKNPGLIFRLANFQRISVADFKQHAYANRKYTVKIGKKTRVLSAPYEWIEWPRRAEVERITYQPGRDRIIEGPELNVWKGWKVEPAKGNIKPWLELLTHLFDGARPEERRWFEQWLAYPLQHPGAKLSTAAVLWSLAAGPGKTTVGYTMEEIYGENFKEIGDRELFSNFNEWAENRQFVMGDEITGGGLDKQKNADRLKTLITQHSVRLNLKYVPAYTVPDCINYLFTSNHPDAFYIADNDRRLFIHEVQSEPKSADWFSQTYYPWLRKEGGAAALFDHLLDLDLTGFNPVAPAPVTASKQEMREASMGALRLWLNQLRSNPSAVLKGIDDEPHPHLLKREVWTARELVNFFNRQNNDNQNDADMGRALCRAGCRKVPYDNSPKNEKVQNLVNETGEPWKAVVWWIWPGPPPAHLQTMRGVREQYMKERPRNLVAKALVRVNETKGR
jgi:hypothetical protein